MNLWKALRSPYLGLALNFLYAMGNCIIGFLNRSFWFVSVGLYFTVLAATRFSVLILAGKSAEKTNGGLLIRRMTGILLIVLSVCIIGVNVMSAVKDRGNDFHEIVMITIATFTFAKITVAIVGMVKAKQSFSPIHSTLRNVSLADACVSVHTMQRSMLVSFPGMKASEILLLNVLTGTAVWLIVLLLGINLLGGKYTEMAKSKIVQANEKIAESVTGGYKKIEKGVVDGYKKIEKAAVDGYTKIEERFVANYLTKDGETVEEAKERLKKEEK